MPPAGSDAAAAAAYAAAAAAAAAGGLALFWNGPLELTAHTGRCHSHGAAFRSGH